MTLPSPFQRWHSAHLTEDSLVTSDDGGWGDHPPIGNDPNFVPGPFPIQHISEFLSQAEDETRWHLPLVAPAGALSLIIGGPKVGKSQLVYGILAELWRNSTVFGRPRDPGITVQIWTEESPETIKPLMKRVKLTQDMLVDAPWYIATRRRLVGKPWAQIVDDALETWAQNKTKVPDVLIVDTLGGWAASGKDTSDYGAMTAMMQPLHRILNDYSGLSVITIHHSRKAGATDTTDRTLGSTAIAGMVDNLLMVKRVEGNRPNAREIAFEGRLIPSECDDDNTVMVNFDWKTGQYTAGTTMSNIVAILSETTDALTTTEIHIQLGGDNVISKRQTERTLNDLVDRQELERLGSKSRGYRYALATDPRE